MPQRQTEGEADMRGTASSLPLGAEHDRNGLDELQRLHHCVCRGLIFVKVRGLQMRLVSIPIGVNLENPDAGGTVFVGHSVEDQNAGLDADCSLDLLVNGGLVLFQLRGIDFDFGDLHVGARVSSATTCPHADAATSEAPKNKSCFASISASSNATSRAFR